MYIGGINSSAPTLSSSPLDSSGMSGGGSSLMCQYPGSIEQTAIVGILNVLQQIIGTVQSLFGGGAGTVNRPYAGKAMQLSGGAQENSPDLLGGIINFGNRLFSGLFGSGNETNSAASALSRVGSAVAGLF